MNYLKSKRNYFILFACILGFFSFLMVACEKDTKDAVIPQEMSVTSKLDVADVGESHQYYFPTNIRKQGIDGIEAYTKNLSPENSEKLKESYRVFRYLKDIDLLHKVENELSPDLMLADAKLDNYLDTKQLEELQNYVVLSDCCFGEFVENLWICGCSGKWEYCIKVDCFDGNTDYCDCWVSQNDCNTTNILSPSDIGNLSAFISTEMGQNGKKLLVNYIKYKEDIELILYSEDPQYTSVQKSFNKLAAKISSLNEGFSSTKSTYTITNEDITLLNNFLTELADASTSAQIKEEIKSIQDNIGVVEGKNVINALKAFNQASR